MLDQSFSANNFMNVYARENRMGRIPVETMGRDFQTVVGKIKTTNSELQALRNKKKDEKTDEDKEKIKFLKQDMNELRRNKQKTLLKEMQELSARVNSYDFHFKLNKVLIGDKMGFKIDSQDHVQLFAMKQLQSNLHKTFKVKQSNRHLIMTNIKLLLKTKRPFYIIRTDVSSFFESIPQAQLKQIVMDNTVLSHKSKVFVTAILNGYEVEKSKLSDDESEGMNTGCGVPRGIGISSLLSEIYMRDLDNLIKKRPEVIFYARYVDDIFMLLTELPQGQNIETYYDGLVKVFKDKGLDLKSVDEDKCILFDCQKYEEDSFEITYLGYKLTIENKKTESVWKSADIKYGMSANKLDRVRRRIDNAFMHFNKINKFDLHQARKDLVDSLKLITGNVKLHKSKSGIKTGLYYNSDLLDDNNDLSSLNTYLYSKEVIIHPALFHTPKEKNTYLAALYKRIKKFDFVTAWHSKKMYDLTDRRIKEIMRWLNDEAKED